MLGKKKKVVISKGPSCEQVAWWIIIALVFLGLFGFILYLISYPYGHSDYYRNAKLLNGETKGRHKCTVGEIFRNDLEICAPIVYSPLPISPELKDNTVRACDNFYEHMSGTWIKTHQNENRAFTFAHRKNQKYVHDIIRDPSTGPIYKFYRSCLDTIVHRQHYFIDKSQVKHVREHIIGAFQTHGDLPVVFARLAKYGFTSPFLFTIEPHPTKPEMVPLIRRDIIPDQLGAVEMPITMVYDLEQCLRKMESWHTDTEFTGASFVDYVRSDFFKRDMTTVGTLLDGSPKNFWEQYFRELNGYQMERDLLTTLPKRDLWLLDRHYMQNLMHNINDITLREWRAFLEFSVLYSTKDFVPDLHSSSYFRVHNPIHRRNARFPERMLRTSEPTEHTCLSVTHKLFPGAIGNVFIDRHVQNHDAIKAQVKELTENINTAYMFMIHNTTWMSDGTKEKMITKMESTVIRVIRPNYYEEEAVLERMTMDSFLRNVNIARQYIVTRNFELWTKGKPNRDEIQRFGSPIDTVNAYYSPRTNTITLFAGILTEPFYNITFDEVALYAALGLVVAHERGHGVDNKGRLYDEEGSLSIREPWTAEEAAEFEKRTAQLADEYEAPFGCINAEYGHQTIGEDIADLVGIRAAYLALEIKKNRKLTKEEARHFFEVFAQLWAEVYSQEILCDRVDKDEHAISLFRVIKTLRQIPHFAWAYGCKEKDAMVNENRVVIYGE